MARSGLMKASEVWLQAGSIVAAHGELAVDYVIDQLRDALGGRVAVEDWRRVTAAVDAIPGAQPR